MSKKYVISSYQVYENDAFRDYLEAMALKGWRLTKIGSLLLRFESCIPHPIRYCVEVMEKPSAYASNQTLPLRRYREFCRDAGWSYLGTNGLLHVFCTEDMEAVPVETNAAERYEHICRACTGNYRTITVLFTLMALMNLFLCYRSRTLFSTNGFVVLILAFAMIYTVGDYLLWIRKAKTSIECSQTLPVLSYTAVRVKNAAALAGICILCVLFFIYSLADLQFSKRAAGAIAVYLIVYGIMLAIFTALLHWLREKNAFSTKVNIAIYWGVAAILILLVTIVLLLLLFWII